jgi:hypothetical protein
MLLVRYVMTKEKKQLPEITTQDRDDLIFGHDHNRNRHGEL